MLQERTLDSNNATGSRSSGITAADADRRTSINTYVNDEGGKNVSIFVSFSGQDVGNCLYRGMGELARINRKYEGSY